MIDTKFAKILMQERQDHELEGFLTNLMKKSREGHLCVYDPCIASKAEFLTSGKKSPIVEYKDHYYLRRNFDLETKILFEIKRLLSQEVKQEIKPISDKPLYEAQQIALEKALKNPLTLVSGGPGCGKTYFSSALIDCILSKKKDAKILFTAPTGKAASRIKNENITSKTLHNLLGLREKLPLNFEPNPLVFDFIIADECSMIDANLFAQFLSSIPKNTHVILMGDPDQLPPVEAGFVFPDFFKIDAIEKVHLDQTHRSDRMGILSLAKAIKENNTDQIFSLLEDINVLDVNLVPLPKEPPIPFSNELTILTPFRKGFMGSIFCNEFIEMNKKENLKTPVIITKNDYKFNLMNGDMGWKEGIFGYFPQKLPLALISEYELAWAISIHKSQGSEFEHVFIILPEGSEEFGKELIYTAVTRAKKSVTIASSKQTLEKTLSNPSIPISNLKDRFNET